jgi:hypothetical protein
MNETDLFYYFALAIATFVVLYIIYISIQFQNDVLEGFTMGGSKSKGDGNQKSSIGESLNKTIDNMFDDNTKLESAIKLSDHSDDYKNMIELMKTNIKLNAVQALTKTASDKSLTSDVKAQSITIVSAALKLALEGLGDLEESL